MIMSMGLLFFLANARLFLVNDKTEELRRLLRIIGNLGQSLAILIQEHNSDRIELIFYIVEVPREFPFHAVRLPFFLADLLDTLEHVLRLLPRKRRLGERR